MGRATGEKLLVNNFWESKGKILVACPTATTKSDEKDNIKISHIVWVIKSKHSGALKANRNQWKIK